MCTRAQREWQGKRWLFIGTLRGFTGDDSGNTEVDFVFSYGHGFLEQVVLVICMYLQNNYDAYPSVINECQLITMC